MAGFNSLALAHETIHLTLIVGACVFAFSAAVVLGFGFFRDRARKTRRCRKCLYAMPDPTQTACPKCGWSAKRDKQYYFRKRSRPMVWSAVGLLLLAGVCWYARYVHERVADLSEPLKTAVVPTTGWMYFIPYNDASHDAMIAERARKQAWGWQKASVTEQFRDLLDDPSQTPSRHTEAIGYWARSQKDLVLDERDVATLLALLDPKEADLSIRALSILSNYPENHPGIRDAAADLLLSPSFTKSQYLPAQLVLEHSRFETETLERLLDSEDPAIHDVMKYMYDELFLEIDGFGPDAETMVEVTPGYILLLEKSMTAKSLVLRENILYAVRTRLQFYDPLYSHHWNNPPTTLAELGAMREQLLPLLSTLEYSEQDKKTYKDDYLRALVELAINYIIHEGPDSLNARHIWQQLLTNYNDETVDRVISLLRMKTYYIPRVSAHITAEQVEEEIELMRQIGESLDFDLTLDIRDVYRINGIDVTRDWPATIEIDRHYVILRVERLVEEFKSTGPYSR